MTSSGDYIHEFLQLKAEHVLILTVDIEATNITPIMDEFISMFTSATMVDPVMGDKAKPNPPFKWILVARDGPRLVLATDVAAGRHGTHGMKCAAHNEIINITCTLGAKHRVAIASYLNIF